MGSICRPSMLFPSSCEVGDSDIDDEINRMVESTPEDRREEMKQILDTPQTRGSIRQSLLSRKTLQRIVEIAEGSTETGTATKEEEE